MKQNSIQGNNPSFKNNIISSYIDNKTSNIAESQETETKNSETEKMGRNAKLATASVTAGVALVTLGVLARKGKFGTTLQKWFGNAPKSIEPNDINPNIIDKTSKTQIELQPQNPLREASELTLEPELPKDIKAEKPLQQIEQTTSDIVDEIPKQPIKQETSPNGILNNPPKPKIKPEELPITEKVILGGTEKYQGKNLIERVVTNQDGDVITTKFNLKTGKKESVYTQGTIAQTLEIFAPNGTTLKEKYFRVFGRLHVNIPAKNIELSISGVKTEDFEKAIKLSQKYSQMSDKELETLYKEILEGNPKNISFFEFNIIESFRDLYKLTIPKTSELTQLESHHKINGWNNKFRELQDLNESEIEEFGLSAFKTRMEAIDKEIASLPPLEKDCVFYRGIHSKFIPEIINGKVGDVVIPDKAYAYAAFKRGLANEYGDGTILVIKTPKGAKISRNMEHGGEAIYPRNAQYRIISKSKTPKDDINPKGNWIIELEYILP